MKRVVLAVLLALMSIPAIAIDSESFDDPVLHARYRKLTQELRCLQCQNENIHDSNATLAVDLRREVRAMLLAGKTDEEIIRFLTDRYGDFVLYRPPFVARTIVLWLAPGLALLGGLAAVVVVVRRRATQSFDDATDPASSNTAAGADSQ
jgi:cytochrome c-type biogenesis protein CcmH